MLNKTRELIKEFYNGEIKSQKLVGFIQYHENKNNSEIYDEYFNYSKLKICSICSKEMKFTGFTHGYKCFEKCETKKKLEKLSIDEIKKLAKEDFIKHGGFTKEFGLAFKKYEEILSKFYNKYEKELKYCVIKDIEEEPICEVDGCTNKCKFSKTKYQYAKGCCYSHIMMKENHIWNENSKAKMINSLKSTREEKVKLNPNYFIEINKKLSFTKLNYSDEKKESINQKREETNTEKYGCKNVLLYEDIKEKIRKRNYENFRWIPLEDKEPYNIYFSASSFKHGFSFTCYTTDKEKQLLEQYGVFNTKTNTKGCVRDHLLSRRYGFDNNIATWIISHPANCEIVSNSENIRRANTNDNLITLEELLYRIENYK